MGLSDGTDSAIFTIAFCTLGGLLVGLITHFTKAKPQLLMEEFQEFQDTGRIAPRNGFTGMVRGLVGLIFGGSIGPEGPMTGGAGALGTWLAERRKVPRPAEGVLTYASISGFFGAFLNSPFGMAMFTIEPGLESGKLTWKLLLPGLVAATVGYAVFFSLTGNVFGGLYQFPPYDGLQVVQLLYALILGLIGGAFGLLFTHLYKGMKRMTEPLAPHPIGLAVSAGLILGVLGTVFPLALFDGDSQIQSVIDQAATLGVITLLALALVKVFLTTMCLSFGWSGGYLFPSFFMGASLGLAIHLLLPFIPEVVCMACVMAGISVVLLRAPIAMTFIVQTLFDIRLAPVIAIAIITAFLLSYGTYLVAPLGQESTSR
jgi:H+/Cl- antiporter ClcA